MLRVLVMSERVYDDGDIGSVLLDWSSFRLRSADTAEEALRLLAVWEADLLVTGDRLEDMGINDFLRQAAALVPSMKILILQESLGVDLDEELGDAYLIDPIDRQTFADSVSDLLELGVANHERINFETIAEVTRSVTGRSETAYLLNLSPRGCQVETATPFELNEQLSICFYLPSLITPIRTEATVRARVDDDGLVLGLEFIALDETLQALVVAFCQHTHDQSRGVP